MDVLLVGPAGQQATLMSDAGGEHDADGLSLTFDDEAGSALPDEDTLASQSYRPTEYEAWSDTYSAGAPALDGNTLLSVFDG